MTTSSPPAWAMCTASGLMTPCCNHSAPQPVATADRARLAGFPRLAWTGTDLLVAVTATGAEGGVRVYRVPPPPAS